MRWPNVPGKYTVIRTITHRSMACDGRERLVLPPTKHRGSTGEKVVCSCSQILAAPDLESRTVASATMSSFTGARCGLSPPRRLGELLGHHIVLGATWLPRRQRPVPHGWRTERHCTCLRVPHRRRPSDDGLLDRPPSFVDQQTALAPTRSVRMSTSKEGLLMQVDALRDLARRARRLSATMSKESDSRRLIRQADELHESASRLEAEAVDARTMVIKPSEFR